MGEARGCRRGEAAREVNRSRRRPSLLFLRPEAVGNAALLRPTLPFEPEPLLELFGRRIFLASGERDPYAPPERVRRLAELLSSAGAEVEHHWSPGSHGLEPDDLDEARRWFAALRGRRWPLGRQRDERL